MELATMQSQRGTQRGGVNIRGGAIYLEGGDKFTVANSSFANSYSDFGGAVSISYMRNPINIDHSRFNSNYAMKGGAIFIRDSVHLAVSDSEFSNDKSDFEGGAMAMIWTDLVGITNSTFNGNSSDFGTGSAIYWQGIYSPYSNGGSTTLYIIDSVIENQLKSRFGGSVIHNYLGEIILNNTKFTNNIGMKNCQAVFDAPFSIFRDSSTGESSETTCP